MSRPYTPRRNSRPHTPRSPRGPRGAPPPSVSGGCLIVLALIVAAICFGLVVL